MTDIIGDAFGNDLFGTDADDRYFGFGGFDLLFASRGNDTLDGGSDSDVALYDTGLFTSGVFINNTDTAIGAILAHTVDKRGFGTDRLIDVSNFHGTNFDDVIHVGGNGDTYTFDRAGDDYVEASQSPDADSHVFLTGSGNDTLVGTVSRDRVSYRDHQFDGAGAVTQGVTVDLAAGTATDGFGDTDTLISIERVDGTQFDDTIRGDDARNDLNGLGGNDLLDGRGGSRDRVVYRDDPAAVFVDLAAGTATDGFGGTDTLIGIEEVLGSRFDDTIIGDDADNYIEGNEGDDSLSGGGGRDNFRGSEGNDTIDGGTAPAQFSGGDRVSYDEEADRGATQGVNVNLATGVAIDSFGSTDTLISIEEIRGTDFSDTIVGGAASERLQGRSGDDTIIGGDGNDDLNGGDGNDSLVGGIGGDFIEPGTGRDTIEGGANGPLFERDELSYGFDARDSGTTNGIAVTFTSETGGTVLDFGGETDVFSGIELVRGTQNADSFIGAEGDQQFRGLGGDDAFDGGAGSGDRVDYSRADDDTGAFRGIDVSLAAGTGTDANGDTDTFANIEEIRGSRFDDTIIGDGSRNELRGEQGDDLLDSFGGQDNFLEGGRGNDTLEARGDGDDANGGEGNDLITFHGVGGFANPGLGSDTIVAGTEGFFDIGYGGLGQDLIIDVALGSTTIVGTSDVDTFTNIVNVGGGDGNDTLLGNDGERQEFFSSLGDDFIDGRGTGQNGDRDWLIYNWSFTDTFSDADRAVVVDFSTGTATGILAGTDSFINIEAVRASRADDLLIGSDQAYEEFQPMAGNDTIEGGAGLDRVSYSFEDNRGGTQAITIDLAGPLNADGYLEVQDTFGDTDLLSGIEQVTGSAFGDVISGTDAANVLIGQEGADTLNGRGGDDFIWGGEDIDRLTGGAGADEFGGFIDLLDGDTITDFSIDDSISIFDSDFNQLAANVDIVGNELRLDTNGDGTAEATLFLENGYAGPVKVNGGPIGGPESVVFEVADAGLFTAVVDEDDVVANVTITRSGDLLSTATVDVTLSGSGVNPVQAADLGVPFDVPIRLTFAPGQTQVIYQIGITDDLDVEGVEDLAFSLSNATSDGAGGAQIDGDTTFVRILDNDIAPNVRIEGEKRPEDAGEIAFTVSRTGDISAAITVPYQITSALGLQGAEADDLVGGLPQSGSVVIAAGASSATFTVAVAPDAVAELHDDIIATISVGNDWPAGLTVGVAQATGSIRNDDGVPPVLPAGATGSNFGDPHIVTLDGLAYDFQAVGEFTLIEAASGDPLEVQVRFQPVDGSQVASQTTAVATALGAARVVIDIDGSSLVSVGGAGFDLSSAVGGAMVGDGEIYYDGEAVTLVYANGEQLRVDVFDGFLSTSVSLASGRDVRGLLGNADGDTANDLALRDGTVLAQPVDFADLYGPFADNWRISDVTSLFDYAPGEGTADFTDSSFPVAGVTLEDFPAEVVAAAASAAAGIDDPALRDAAILDYLVSGSTDYIAAATVVDEARPMDVVATEPTNAPVIPAGIGISVSEAQIVEGDSGAQSVSFTIYRTGDLSDEVRVDYALGGDADSDDYAGASAGSLSFAAGEARQVVTLDVTGDGAVESNETLSMSFTVTSAAMPIVISSTASLTIVNDDLAPVDPELTPIEGSNRSDVLRGTEGADLITGFGGPFDRLFGLGGEDVFVFGAETRNGVRDRDTIYDYEVGIDSILLTDGAAIGAVRDTKAGAVVFLEGDGDAIYLRGADIDADTITFIFDDLAIA